MVTQAAQIGESKTSENRPCEGAESRAGRAKPHEGKKRVVPDEEGPAAEAPTAFDVAVGEFLAYLQGYRQPALS
jgi:hypothetical protein